MEENIVFTFKSSKPDERKSRQENYHSHGKEREIRRKKVKHFGGPEVRGKRGEPQNATNSILSRKTISSQKSVALYANHSIHPISQISNQPPFCSRMYKTQKREEEKTD